MSTETRTTSSTGGQKGVKLARFDLIPAGPEYALAEHYGVGAFKYDDNQWRDGYEVSKSYAAMRRHENAWKAGHSYDTCSAANYVGCRHTDMDGNPFTAPREDACFNHTASHHLTAVIWHCMAIQEFEERFPEHDDRYRPGAAKIEPTREGAVGTMHYVEGWLSGEFPEASQYLKAHVDEIADHMVDDECARGEGA